MFVPEKSYLIQNGTLLVNDTYLPLLELLIEPGRLSNASKLAFNWTLVEFTSA